MSRCPEAHDPGNKSILLCYGSRNITQRDIAQIQQILADSPDWNRQQVSMHFCRAWNWRRSDGVLNHRTCRDLLTRLHLVSDNTRFLILPGIRIKNLTSKVLSANLRRLSRDLKERYGNPILLAETFVDLSRFAGTCYRASGSIPLGQTGGFARTGNGYQAHGKPKMLGGPLRRPADIRHQRSPPTAIFA